MTQFRERDFDQRFKAMGDEAEAVFEAVYPQGYARTGLCRPPIRMSELSVRARYMPDYLTSKGWVEVQGFGADQTVKTKAEKLAALYEYHRHDPVRMFLWDSSNKRWALVDLEDFNELQLLHGTNGVFPEGKPYTALHASHIEGWRDHAEAA